MIKEVPTISRTLARQLAITAQCLAGPRRNPDIEGIMDVINQLVWLQLDPINAVARSHLLVLWSRLGSYDPKLLDTLLWQERRLFEYWAHAASIVVTQNYPIQKIQPLLPGSHQDGRVAAMLAKCLTSSGLKDRSWSPSV